MKISRTKTQSGQLIHFRRVNDVLEWSESLNKWIGIGPPKTINKHPEFDVNHQFISEDLLRSAFVFDQPLSAFYSMPNDTSPRKWHIKGKVTYTAPDLSTIDVDEQEEE
jgi:hypothetical protein